MSTSRLNVPGTRDISVATIRKTGDSTRLGYRPWLDGIRGIAISCVLFFHIGHVVFEGGPMVGSYLGLPQGYLGVDIFFVLSGFLITTLLLEEWERNSDITLRGFYLRRALRLLPALSVFLASVALWAIWSMPREQTKQVLTSTLYTILYIANWASALNLGEGSPLLSHTWSLSIEEQFYLVWPILLLTMLRLKFRRGQIVFLTITAIIGVAFHRNMLSLTNVPIARVYAGADTRADSLLVGCLVSMLVTWRMLWRSKVAYLTYGFLAFVSLLVIELYLTAHMPGNRDSPIAVFNFGLTLFALSVGSTILLLMIKPPRIALKFLEATPLVWLGKISYSLYLWHLFAALIALELAGSSPHLAAALTVAIGVALAAASYYLIERPFLKLKSRLSVSRRSDSRVRPVAVSEQVV